MAINIQSINLPRAFHKKYLETINGVKFTHREIDIIAFILTRRSSKTIASLLSISPRTVENHIGNIMVKLECNSREAIIDFAEKSGKLPFLKDYYLKSLSNIEFEKFLKSFRLSKNKESSLSVVIYWPSNQELEESLAYCLADHLNKVGIPTTLKSEKNCTVSHQTFSPNYAIYCFAPKEPIFPFSLEKERSSTLILLLPDGMTREWLPKELRHFKCIELSQQENYYLFVFEILKIFFPESPSLYKLITQFQRKIKELGNSSAFLPAEIYEESAIITQHPDVKKKGFLRKPSHPVFVSLFSTCVIGGLVFLALKIYFQATSKDDPLAFRQQARSDLIIPIESIFLDRSEILAQMENIFKSQTTKIQTVALVGIGGAGKTTLARQYASLQKISVVWEINAETKENLLSSLETLANAFAITEDDKKNVRKLMESNTPLEREEKIIQWVKQHLKACQCWLLIYDNVERFRDIEKYFPSDPNDWGKGKVIITTRDSNIQDNSLIHGIVQVGELSPQDSLSLFMKVMTNGNKIPFMPCEKEQSRKFLEAIPPFPLDISSAAYYLKATNISYEKYLEHLGADNKDFALLQENVLKETGNYAKTRYGILSLSFKRLLDTHQDFAGLLVFMNLLDSQHIPRELLESYKSGVVIDSFIYYLKKYSLIPPKSLTSFHSVSTFSIHRSTQETGLAYLTEILKLDKNNHIIQSVGRTLIKYMREIISKEDFSRMKIVAPHGEAFLAHSHLLENEIYSSLGAELGEIYFYLGNYEKAKKILDASLSKVTTPNGFQYPACVAQILSHSGIVSRELGNYEEAKKLLEQSLQIYNRHFPQNYEGITRALTYLGIVSRELGHYEEAKKILGQSLQIYTHHLSENYVGIARVLGYLGIVSRELGNYQEAKNLLEKTLTVYKQHLPQNYIGMAWSLVHLGKVYKELGECETAKNLSEEGFNILKQHLPDESHAWVMLYLASVYKELNQCDKAKDLIEQSLAIYQETLPEDHVYKAWAVSLLGGVYKKLGDYEKAKNCFEKTLSVYEKKYGRDHIEIARILNEIGQTCFLKGQVEAAETYMNEALKIFEKRKHPERYVSLENLADLYLKKAVGLNQNTQIAMDFKKKAFQCLQQAYDIAKNNFPKACPHTIRIEKKIVRVHG